MISGSRTTIVSFSPVSRRRKHSCRAVADDTLGDSGAAVKPCHSIVGRIAPTYLICRPLERGASALCQPTDGAARTVALTLLPQARENPKKTIGHFGVKTFHKQGAGPLGKPNFEPHGLENCKDFGMSAWRKALLAKQKLNNENAFFSPQL